MSKLIITLMLFNLGISMWNVHAGLYAMAVGTFGAFILMALELLKE